MTNDSVAYFFFKSRLEFEKKTYQLSITAFYNNKLNRKEFEIASNEFNGLAKRLIYKSLGTEREWLNINDEDNSALIQEIGDIIYRHNI